MYLRGFKEKDINAFLVYKRRLKDERVSESDWQVGIAVAIVVVGVMIANAITYAGVEIGSQIAQGLSTIASQTN